MTTNSELPEDTKREESLYEFVASTFPAGTMRNLIDLRYRTILHYAKKKYSEEMSEAVDLARREGDTSRVTRIEVVDETGRAYLRYNMRNVRISIQDDGRTLKVFVSKRESQEKTQGEA